MRCYNHLDSSSLCRQKSMYAVGGASVRRVPSTNIVMAAVRNITDAQSKQRIAHAINDLEKREILSSGIIGG